MCLTHTLIRILRRVFRKQEPYSELPRYAPVSYEYVSPKAKRRVSGDLESAVGQWEKRAQGIRSPKRGQQKGSKLQSELAMIKKVDPKFKHVLQSKLSGETVVVVERKEKERPKTRKSIIEPGKRESLTLQEEMDLIRQSVISRYVENHVESEESLIQKDQMEQKRLAEKLEEANLWQEALDRRRAEENRRLAEIERQKEEARQKDLEVMRRKVASGVQMSDYEKKLAIKMGVLQKSEAEAEAEETCKELHSSAITERPKVRRLEENESLEKARVMVSEVLDKVDSGTDQTAMGAPTTTEELSHSTMETYSFSNQRFFTQFPLKDPERDRNSIAFADFLTENPAIEKLECYNSALDDTFAIRLAEHIASGKLVNLKEIHLESNLFSGSGLEALLKALSNPHCAPYLKTVKLVNQKETSKNAAQAALSAVESNSSITKLSLDFRSDIDIANLNRLLARNANLVMRKRSLAQE